MIRFIEKPNAYKNIKLDNSEIGTVINGINDEVKFFKNMYIIIVTKNIARIKVMITSFSASDTKTELS